MKTCDDCRSGYYSYVMLCPRKHALTDDLIVALTNMMELKHANHGDCTCAVHETSRQLLASLVKP